MKNSEEQREEQGSYWIQSEEVVKESKHSEGLGHGVERHTGEKAAADELVHRRRPGCSSCGGSFKGARGESFEEEDEDFGGK